jgi:hypothetical protein
LGLCKYILSELNYTIYRYYTGKKAKGHIITSHEDTERRKKYRYTSELHWWVVNATPRPLYLRKKPQYSDVGGAQGLSGRVRKFSHPPGFKPRTT